MPENLGPAAASIDAGLALLTVRDITEIFHLEQACWPALMQAGAELIESRFASGHEMVGAWREGHLAGLIAYRHVRFDPDHLSDFPRSFGEYASGSRQPGFNAVFGYNLSVHPSHRGSRVIDELLDFAIERVRSQGCRYIVGDGRCPSYEGGYDPGKPVPRSPVFRAAVDRHMGGGAFPSLAEFLADPALRFFYRKMHCRFLRIMPQFYPADLASGGYRVIYCVDFGHGDSDAAG